MPPWGLGGKADQEQIDQLLDDIAHETRRDESPWLRVVTSVHNPDEISLEHADLAILLEQNGEPVGEQDDAAVEHEVQEVKDSDHIKAGVLEQDSESRTPARGDISRGSQGGTSVTAQKDAPNDIPYHERNKRNWEQYIERADPNEGSMTHRRLARELDSQATATICMDYGEADSATAGPQEPNVSSGRRIVSYEDF